MKKHLLIGLLSILSINTIAQSKKISFETSEGFTLGSMNGQQNWYNWGYVTSSTSNVVKTLASEGVNSVYVQTNTAAEGDWGGILYELSTLTKFTLSADVYLEDTDNSDYDMLSLYNSDFDYLGGFYFDYTGAISIGADADFEEVGTWTPKKWYNIKSEIDLTTKTIKYYLDNKLVRTMNTTATEIVEFDFELDNYGSGFYVDNVYVINNENMSTTDLSDNQYTIYPNPTSDILNIRTIKKVDSIEVYNLVGKFVLKSDKQQSINVEHLNTGTYIIKIKTGDKIVSKKFIKK